MKEAINEHVWGMARGAKAVAMRKRKIIREDSTDISQMTSNFVEIVPRPHLQGNCIPFAAIR